ncbi:MAG: hypothetical protein ACE5J1_00525 [Nitrospiria bacterium]
MADRVFPDRVWRGMIAIAFSLLLLRLPQLMPVALKRVIVVIICVVFVALPDRKGLQGGIIAGFFSLVFAGLGHLYVRQYVRAFFFLLGGLFAYQISGYAPQAAIFNKLLFIVAAVDAFSFGKRGFGIF